MLLLLLLLDETTSIGGVGTGGAAIDAPGAGCALALSLLLLLPPPVDGVAISVDGLGVGCCLATDGGLFDFVACEINALALPRALALEADMDFGTRFGINLVVGASFCFEVHEVCAEPSISINALSPFPVAM